ncbi:MAG TPA: extracellular solute-binding protein [Ktedonobacteraceae bacterium]|nr:extracellular solute-binding protein [Ktedonobacteraceae bacterium]
MFFKQQTQTPPTFSHQLNVAMTCCGLMVLITMLLAACGGTTTTGSGTPTAAARGKISVLYAGSLVNLMEKKIGPAFTQATGYPYEGEGKGSTALAAEIKGHLRTPDIFISASAAVDKSLMGSANGNYVSWYATFTRTEMVIGYSPQSKFAADFQAAANGTKSWYSVLEEPGIRIGRTDPALDPKGISTIILMELAEKYYNQPGLTGKILGSNSNTSQLFPEETLAARLGSGQLDAGFFYLNEVKDLNLPYIALPAQINLSDPSMNSTYATANYTDPKTGKKSTGAAIAYTITIPSTSKNTAGAIAFANFLLSSQGQTILMGDGLLQTTPTLFGSTTDVPAQLQQYFQ